MLLCCHNNVLVLLKLCFLPYMDLVMIVYSLGTRLPYPNLGTRLRESGTETILFIVSDIQ